ncbi:MAG: hypothetical protein EU529_12370 [Promethearchaeota archaeon]|nr:MAG: hypothetical protein EU529_12370 [Candidatus Lokiarchaeota archaeon]
MITKKIEIGQEIPSFKVKMEKKTYKQYNKLAKEINPMHLSKLYVHNRLGYDDILIAGNFLFSFVPKWIIDWIDGNINALSSITIKFENPVYPNDEIIFNGKIIDIKQEDKRKVVYCEYQVEKINNERVMSGTVNLSFSK